MSVTANRSEGPSHTRTGPLPDTLVPSLDRDQLELAAGPIAINLASRSSDMVPSIARGYGCRVSADGRALTVFLSVPHSLDVLRDLRAGAPVAVVLSRPMNHKSLQVKGERALVLELEPQDRDLMRAYGHAFAAEIRALGYDDAFARALVAPSEQEAVAVSFEIASVFEQTPGPRAGERLGPRP